MTESTGVKIEPSRLRKTKWQEYAVRFIFGGAITALTGLVAHLYGPVIGGLFLAFPAILPASLTLIEKHSGKEEAEAAAHGATIATAGLFGFGAVVWALAGQLAAWLVLLIALIVWAVLAVGLWFLIDRILFKGQY
jgi:hypothetical protein